MSVHQTIEATAGNLKNCIHILRETRGDKSVTPKIAAISLVPHAADMAVLRVHKVCPSRVRRVNQVCPCRKRQEGRYVPLRLPDLAEHVSRAGLQPTAHRSTWSWAGSPSFIRHHIWSMGGVGSSSWRSSNSTVPAPHPS